MAYYNAPYMQPYGGGYPNIYAQNPMQMQQPAQMTQPQPQNNNGILWVQGEAGAKAWAVAPGQSVTLMDSENPALYLKSADMSGVPSMRIFDLVERTTKPSVPPVTAPQIDLSNYITRKEFDELKASLTTTSTAKKKAVEHNGEPSV